VAEDADDSSPRAVAPCARPVELLADDAKRQELVALEAEDGRQPLDVVGREQPVPAACAPRRDEPLILEIPDLRHGDVGELLAELLAHRADRARARLGASPPFPTCRHGAHRWRKVRRVLADLHLVVVLEHGGLDASAVDVGAVQASEIADGERLTVTDELGVPS
jgi:hypothetical protein